MKTEITKLDRVRQVFRYELPGLMGQENLSSMASLAEPRGSMDVQPNVAARSENRFAGVYSHAHRKKCAIRPRMDRKGPLRLDSGQQRVLGPLKHKEKTLPSVLVEMPARRLGDISQQPAVIREDLLSLGIA
jgi:hypothetical protein